MRVHRPKPVKVMLCNAIYGFRSAPTTLVNACKGAPRLPLFWVKTLTLRTSNPIYCLSLAFPQRCDEPRHLHEILSFAP
jgi:hypothetical protein